MFGLRARSQPSFPLLDGPLRPNDALEEADALALPDPNDLCVAPDGSLLVSSGNRLLRYGRWSDDRAEQVAEFDGTISALACRDDGLLAAGIEGGGVRILEQDGRASAGLYEADIELRGVTACLFAENGDLVVADAAPSGDPYPYTRELFAGHGAGRIVRIAADGATSTLASGLRCPHGVVQVSNETFMISDCWASGLRSTGAGAAFNELPGYPARIHRRQGGGYILACLARRDPLIDFIRTEDAFAERMMADIEPAFWVAPRLSAETDHRYPVQAGATRLFGETKPWAPSLSYGLVVLLDDDFAPVGSLHSRANGTRHGVTAAIEWGGDIVAVSKGSGELLRVKQSGGQS